MAVTLSRPRRHAAGMPVPFPGGFVGAALAAGAVGFGIIANGVIALVGVCGGVYLRYALFSSYRAEDGVLTIAAAVVTAVVLLFAIVFAKNRLS